MGYKSFMLRRAIRKRRDVMSSITLGISQAETYLSRLQESAGKGKSWCGYELALKRLQLQFDAFCRKPEIAESINICFLLQLENDIYDLLGVIIKKDQIRCTCAAKVKHDPNSNQYGTNGTSDSSTSEPNLVAKLSFCSCTETNAPSLMSKFISVRKIFRDFFSRVRY